MFKLKKAKDKKFSDLKIGETAFFERKISENDLFKFADLSGDHNPLHLDRDYANQTAFKDRVVYGMFLGALVSRLIGMELPGQRALLIKEGLEFKKPARVGDTLKIKGKLIHKSEISRVVEIRIEVTKKKTLLACGSAHVQIL